ncbi:MAG: hypothetical protein QXG39_08385 [Candidatus Aenigmatarchaeota archaeon]
MMIVTFNTKGGVGKSTILQQVVVPFLQDVVYIDTDRMNQASRFIEKSKYVSEIIKHKISSEEDIANLISVIAELLNENKKIVIDPPAADAAKNIYEVITAFDENCFVLVPVLDNDDNYKIVVRALEDANIRHAVIFNKTKKEGRLYLESLSAVLEFAKEKQKTIYELSEYEADNLKDKAFIELIKKIYAKKIENTINMLKEVIK